jgi:hydrogenase maturation protein HypF
VAVQHHLAHVAAVAAEHRVTDAVLGLALDGFGLGPNAESWGGELLWMEGARWRRLGHLRELLQPGGDVAATQPWRMGAAALFAIGREAEIVERFADQPGSPVIAEMLCKRINSPSSSSCGRLFDAACGLLNVVPRASFEGQAPMVLENLVEAPRVLEEGWSERDGVLDLRPLLAHLLYCSPRTGAEIFHGTLIAALTDWVCSAAARTGTERVALSGGCLLNQVLANGLVRELERVGLEALLPIRLPPNDGAVSLGQAWVAGLLCAGEAFGADGATPCA